MTDTETDGHEGRTVVVAGTDEYDIATAIDTEGFDAAVVDTANRPALEEAGIVDAYTLVLTEVEQATAIPVAKDLNPDLTVVVYADGSIPDFARRQTDLALDPALFDPADVAAEL
jgi:Trk K+ transport system NAD-binding subunit